MDNRLAAKSFARAEIGSSNDIKILSAFKALDF